jgi:hypothetical protein
MRKLLIIGFFFLIAPLNLIVGLSILAKNLKRASVPIEQRIQQKAVFPSQLYAALPQSVGEVLGVFSTADARPVIIEKYLEKHHSPMPPEPLLEAADRHNVDPWLIIAIAQCESNLCTKYPEGSYNCWGFENGATRFLSWEQAYDQVAKTLRERYLNLGLETPEEIMPKYAPPSVEKGGPWAKCVRQFMEELELGQVD